MVPGGVVTANEVYIPAGERLSVRLESADVIHDFWAPLLGRKMDMVPGWTNHIWLQADRPGTYLGACAEYCGAEHAWMRFLVIAQPPADFAAWAAQQAQSAPATGSEERGRQLFLQMTCVNCHAIQGVSAVTNVAPDVTIVASRLTPEQMILRIANGGVNMPAYAGNLTPQQMDEVVAFLQSRLPAKSKD